MFRPARTFIALVVCIGLAIAAQTFAQVWAQAQAQANDAPAWPTRPIRLISPFPAGSVSDVAGRILAERLGVRFGTTVIVENRPGASGTIGSEYLARSAPDGYTFGFGTSSSHAVAVSVMKNLQYDPIRDFTPVAMVATTPYVLVVYPDLPIHSVSDLIAFAKRQPGKLTFGTAGPASLANLAAVLFESMADVSMTPVPYKGTEQSVVDIIGGRIDLQFAAIAPTLPNLRSKNLRALAVTSQKEVAALPGVPSMSELGLPGYEAILWLGLFAPRGTPPAIVDRLRHEIFEILGTNEVKEALLQQGFEATPGGPEMLTEQIRGDVAKWKVLVAKAGIESE